MSTRFKSQPSSSAPIDDVDTVAALVRMLMGMGLDRSRIDALIDKASPSGRSAKTAPEANNVNNKIAGGKTRRSA